MKKKRYVLGFGFLQDWSCLLIERTKDDWQKGLVNGLGGHIEEGESPHAAMVREFHEESRILTHRKQWIHFLTLSGEDWEMFVFRALLFADHYEHTSHEGIVKPYNFPPPNMEPSARWLYWMCKDVSTFNCVGLSTEKP